MSFMANINPARNRIRVFFINHGTKKVGNERGERTEYQLRGCCASFESGLGAIKIFNL